MRVAGKGQGSAEVVGQMLGAMTDKLREAFTPESSQNSISALVLGIVLPSANITTQNTLISLVFDMANLYAFYILMKTAVGK